MTSNTASASITGLVAAYNFDEVTGTVLNDYSGNNNTGTVQGEALWATGQYEGALDFDGSDDYVTLGNIDVGGSAFSATSWFRKDACPSGDCRILSKAVSSSEQSHYFMVSLINGNQLRFRLKTDGTTHTLIGGTIADATWSHVAAVYDGATMKIYVDGTEVASAVKTGTLDTNASVPVWIAANPTNIYSPWIGGIDNLRIYSTALTPQEVLTDMATAVDGTPLVYQCSDEVDNDADGLTDYPDDLGCTSITDDDETDPVPDIEAPSVPTNLTATALGVSQINLSWSASVDNVGVAHYSLERCTGASCLNFSQIASPTGTSYSDNGLTAETIYRYQVRATDEAGNQSSYSDITTTTTLSTTNADLDFQTRCNGDGVLLCEGFDDATDFECGGSPEGLQPIFGTNICRGYQDALLKASGNSSLRFEILSNTSADVAGNYTRRLTQKFSQNSTFYLQFQQRFDENFLDIDFYGLMGISWKQVVLWDASAVPCSVLGLVTVKPYSRNSPIIYSECGNRSVRTDLTDITHYTTAVPYLSQQGTSLTDGYNCQYGAMIPGTGDGNGCFYYPKDKWVTFYYKVEVGTFGQPNSRIQAWVSVDGQPYKQWINVRDYTLRQNSSPSDGFSILMLTPYMTAKDSAVSHPTAYTWYDELIVSTQPIAAPSASTGPTAARFPWLLFMLPITQNGQQ